MSLPTPIALPLPSALHFLHYILSLVQPSEHDGDCKEQSLLVICSTRSSFLHTLTHADGASENSNTLLGSLVSTPLHILAAATRLKIVFTPTVQHLRVYLASLPSCSSSSSSSKAPIRMLAIWGLVEAHSGTTEFSAQGISRTVASAVAAGVKGRMWVVVGGAQDSNELGGTSMDVQVPVLNSTVQLNDTVAVVARRKVNVRDIFARWFLWKADGAGSSQEQEGSNGNEDHDDNNDDDDEL
ncbi:hypothetical protein BDZ91DRAFT_229697 [Kalaharituber pfeilii]|nr:hypothetical protein BDZ91DRAFT_229697 [Kalaharituber pfeilii]